MSLLRSIHPQAFPISFPFGRSSSSSFCSSAHTATSVPELPLPHSALPPYNNSFAEIERRLKSISSVGSFIDFLKEHDVCDELDERVHGEYVWDDELAGLMPWEEKLAGCYKSIIGHCLLLPELFPRGTMPFLAPGNNQNISLSLAQCRCLTAHRFIGSFKPVELHPCKWPLNLNHWLGKRPNLFPEGQAFLECLLDYFTDFPPGSADEQSRSVSFARHLLTEQETPHWDSDEFSNMCIAEAEVVDDGTAIGDIAGEVVTDFANEDIGPSEAGTQEEIIFGFSPDLQPAVLFAGRMRRNECIVMSGSRTFGAYSGYSSGLQYRGRTHSAEEQTVLCIDALPMTSRAGTAGRLLQLEGDILARELNKALVGFRAVASDSAAAPAVLATGKWGCGVFGGDMDVKHTVQMMACALLQGRLRLKFYCIDPDAFSARLAAAQPLLAGKTVRDVYRLLEAYRAYVQREQNNAAPFYEFLAHRPPQVVASKAAQGQRRKTTKR